MQPAVLWLMSLCKHNEKPFILDVRGQDEYELMRLGIGETLIPCAKVALGRIATR